MIEKDLKNLAGGTPPEPSETARKRALEAGLHAFEAARAENKSQEFASTPRLTHSDIYSLWRKLMTRLMQRRLMIGTALSGTLALTLMVVITSRNSEMTPFEDIRLATPTELPADFGTTRGLDDRVADNNEIAQIAATPTSDVDAVGGSLPAQGERQEQFRLDEGRVVRDAPVGREAVTVVQGAIIVRETEETISLRELQKQVQSGQVASELKRNKADARVRSELAAPMALTTGIVAPSDRTPPIAQYVGGDNFEDIVPNAIFSTADDPVSTLSVDVDTASYAFVRRALMSGVLPQKDAVRVEEMINYFDYDYALPDGADVPFKPSVTIYPTPWNTGTKLLHIGIKGHDIVPAEKPRSNLVFLLDVSGSMNSPDKLPLLQNAFRLMVDNLDPDDTVAIVTYAGRAGTVLEPTKVKDKGKILAALAGLTSGGSTAGAQGIEQAYALAEAGFDKEGVNRVILATDGDFNVGITNQEELKGFIERKRDSGIFLSVLGFGQGNYNDALMQALAQNGNGNAAYIDTLSEARKVLVEEASSTLFPIAKDVKIQIEFNPAMVSEYRLIGYETRLLNRADFNNDKIDAAEIGSGHSVTAIYEITPAGSDAALIDDLRYGRDDGAEDGDSTGEYAFLKMRYKLPAEDTSKLITLAVTQNLEVAELSATSDDVRFATSVAAFGQMLRGDGMTGDYSHDDVIALATASKGEDQFGYRAEFVNLVRLAKSASGL